MAHLWAGEGEEGVGAVGQEELQGGRLQQEARVVQLCQGRQRPSLVRALGPLRAAADRRTLSGMCEAPAVLTGLYRELSHSVAITGFCARRYPLLGKDTVIVSQEIELSERSAMQARA